MSQVQSQVCEIMHLSGSQEHGTHVLHMNGYPLQPRLSHLTEETNEWNIPVEEIENVRGMFSTRSGIGLVGHNRDKGVLILQKPNREYTRLVSSILSKINKGCEAPGKGIYLIGESKSRFHQMIARIDPDKNVVISTIHIEAGTLLYDIAANAQGHVYIIGKGRKGQMLMKWKENQLMWDIFPTAEMIYRSMFTSICVDQQGYIYVAGCGVRDSHSTVRVALLYKFKPDGEVVWIKEFQSNDSCYFSKCAIDIDGHLVGIINRDRNRPIYVKYMDDQCQGLTYTVGSIGERLIDMTIGPTEGMILGGFTEDRQPSLWLAESFGNPTRMEFTNLLSQ